MELPFNPHCFLTAKSTSPTFSIIPNSSSILYPVYNELCLLDFNRHQSRVICNLSTIENICLISTIDSENRDIARVILTDTGNRVYYCEVFLSKFSGVIICHMSLSKQMIRSISTNPQSLTIHSDKAISHYELPNRINGFKFIPQFSTSGFHQRFSNGFKTIDGSIIYTCANSNQIYIAIGNSIVKRGQITNPHDEIINGIFLNSGSDLLCVMKSGDICLYQFKETESLNDGFVVDDEDEGNSLKNEETTWLSNLDDYFDPDDYISFRQNISTNSQGNIVVNSAHFSTIENSNYIDLYIGNSEDKIQVISLFIGDSVEINLIQSILLSKIPYSLSIDNKSTTPATSRSGDVSFTKNIIHPIIQSFSTNNRKYLLIQNFSSGHPLIWDIDNETVVHYPPGTSTGIVSCVAFSPNALSSDIRNGLNGTTHSSASYMKSSSSSSSSISQLVVTGDNLGNVDLYHAENGLNFSRISDHVGPVGSIQFAPSNGAFFLTSGSADGIIYAYDTRSLKQWAKIEPESGKQIELIVIDPTGDYVGVTFTNDFGIYIYYIKTASLIETITVHEDRITDLSFYQNYLISSSIDGNVGYCDFFGRIGKGGEYEKLKHSSPVTCLGIPSIYASSIDSIGSGGSVLMLFSTTVGGGLFCWDLLAGDIVGSTSVIRDIHRCRDPSEMFSSIPKRKKNFDTNFNENHASLVASEIGLKNVFYSSICLCFGNQLLLCVSEESNVLVAYRIKFEDKTQFKFSIAFYYELSSNRSFTGVSRLLNSKYVDSAISMGVDNDYISSTMGRNTNHHHQQDFTNMNDVKFHSKNLLNLKFSPKKVLVNGDATWLSVVTSQTGSTLFKLKRVRMNQHHLSQYKSLETIDEIITRFSKGNIREVTDEKIDCFWCILSTIINFIDSDQDVLNSLSSIYYFFGISYLNIDNIRERQIFLYNFLNIGHAAIGHDVTFIYCVIWWMTSILSKSSKIVNYIDKENFDKIFKAIAKFNIEILYSFLSVYYGIIDTSMDEEIRSMFFTLSNALSDYVEYSEKIAELVNDVLH